jgi:hypothetical protein
MIKEDKYYEAANLICYLVNSLIAVGNYVLSHFPYVFQFGYLIDLKRPFTSGKILLLPHEAWLSACDYSVCVVLCR